MISTTFPLAREDISLLCRGWASVFIVSLPGIHISLWHRNSETTRRSLCCEKLGTSHDVKGFAIGSVLERLLLKEQMMTSVRKTLKRWSGQPKNRSISNELFPEFNHKIGLFWPIDFLLSLPRKFLRNRSIFPECFRRERTRTPFTTCAG